MADVDVNEYFDEYVDIGKFHKLCEECENYELNWSCPPFDFDIEEYWKTYERFKIIAFKVEFDEEELSQTFTPPQLDLVLTRIERIKGRLMNDIYSQEDEDSIGLYLGRCNICMRCTREFGMPCKMPVKMRYSPESLGANIDRTIEDFFDSKVVYAENGKLPQYMFFVGGILYKKIK